MTKIKMRIQITLFVANLIQWVCMILIGINVFQNFDACINKHF